MVELVPIFGGINVMDVYDAITARMTIRDFEAKSIDYGCCA